MKVTTFLVEQHLPRVLAALAVEFMTARKRRVCSVAQSGEVESLVADADMDLALFGACRGGHVQLVREMRARGAKKWHWGMIEACRGGHVQIVEMLDVPRNARPRGTFHRALVAACRGGSERTARLMIERGANNWDDGLREACRGGHEHIARLMIAQGARNWKPALRAAREKGHANIVRLILAHRTQ